MLDALCKGQRFAKNAAKKYHKFFYAGRPLYNTYYYKGNIFFCCFVWWGAVWEGVVVYVSALFLRVLLVGMCLL